MNQISVYQAPTALATIDALGTSIAKSQLFGCSNVEQGKVIAMTCLAKSSDPMSLAQRYDIIQGNLSMKADAMLADFRTVAGGSHRIIERTPEAAEVELIDREGNAQRFRLTWEEAQAEDFTKDKKGEVKANYAFPRKRMQMLWARVTSDGVRAMAPEVVAGIYTPEEISDYPELENDSVGETPVVATVAPETQPQASSTEPEAEEAEYVTVAEDPDKASGAQLRNLRCLFDDHDIPPEKQLAAMKKVGATDFGDLSSHGAQTLIDALHAKGAKPAKDEVSEPSDSPASQQQIDKAVGLMRELAQHEGFSDIAMQIKGMLNKAGMERLTDMTALDVEALTEALTRKNLDVFFKRSLSHHSSANGENPPF